MRTALSWKNSSQHRLYRYVWDRHHSLISLLNVKDILKLNCDLDIWKSNPKVTFCFASETKIGHVKPKVKYLRFIFIQSREIVYGCSLHKRKLGMSSHWQLFPSLNKKWFDKKWVYQFWCRPRFICCCVWSYIVHRDIFRIKAMKLISNRHLSLKEFS